MRLTLAHLVGRGLGGVALNFRGCSGEPNRLARAYHSGDTEDLAWIVDQTRARMRATRLGAIGFSLAGNVLLKYLGERGDATPFAAAVAVSVPYDLQRGVEHLRSGCAGSVYTRYFLRSLQAKLTAKAHLIPRTLLRDGQAARDLEAFDDAVTAPLHGFDDASHYYAVSSSVGFLASIRTPTLLLHARDDPFLPDSSLPLDALRSNPWVRLELTDRGGHLGFFGPRQMLSDTPRRADHPRTAMSKQRRAQRFWAERGAVAAVGHMLRGQ